MYFIFRDDDDEVLRRALSGEIRRGRRRRIRTNIYISFLSWALEFILGSFTIIVLITSRFYEREVISYRWFRMLDTFMLFVVLPCTYILNGEKVKKIVVSQNLYQGIRSIFLPIIQVSPIDGPDPPAQPRNASVFVRNVGSSQEPAERISEEEQNEEEDRNPQMPPSISDQPSDTQPSRISPSHLNSSDTFRDQLPKIEVIPLSNVRVIHVKSARK